MNLELRRTQPDDIDAVCAIIEQARSRLGALGIDQWQNGYPNRAAIEEDVAHSHSYVVVGSMDDETPDEGATEGRELILATAMLEFGGEPTYDAIDGAWLTEGTSDAPTYLTVHRVAVADGATGRGVARFLLAQAEAVACLHGCESVRIDTHEGNVPMRSLLAKCGYAHCGTILLTDPAESTPERLAFEKLVCGRQGAR